MSTTRKLATIRRIADLVPIKGADRIELAIIDGWQVVTQKGQHVKGDLVVFYEIDSWLPAEDPRYASFEERFINWEGKRGMRLKTIKLRKELSQGLIMPVREFSELSGGVQAGVVEGLDVTEVLKIVKWEQAEKANTSGVALKTRDFPYFLRKTDQERIQNYGHMAKAALDKKFEVTVKKDGSSMTVFRVTPESIYYDDAVKLTRGKLGFVAKVKQWFNDRRFGKQPVYGICSRNVLLPLEGDSNFHVAAKPVLDYLKLTANSTLDRSVAIQGELVAPSIQGNYEKVDGVEFHIFDVFNIERQNYYLPFIRRCWAEEAGLRHCTIVDKGTLREILRVPEGEDDSVVARALVYASGAGDNEGVMREGVVFKAEDHDMSFKAVSNEYLLATGK